MRLQVSLSIVALIFALSFAAGCGGKPPLDLGDGSAGYLMYHMYNSWKVEGDRDQALAYADKVMELHGAEAREMQASLTDYPPTDPPEATYKYQTLNSVGVALWVKGEILMEKGDKSGAHEAYNTLVSDFSYAQYQVPDGMNWIKPAELGKARLTELQADMD